MVLCTSTRRALPLLHTLRGCKCYWSFWFGPVWWHLILMCSYLVINNWGQALRTCSPLYIPYIHCSSFQFFNISNKGRQQICPFSFKLPLQILCACIHSVVPFPYESVEVLCGLAIATFFSVRYMQIFYPN